MIDAVNKLLRMTALKEGLKHYLTADPTSVKAFSNRGTVKLPQSDREVDIGNWSYSVLFNIAMEIAIGCRYYCPLSKLFEQLTVQWPSLQRKWFPTKSSIVRKGDVIEVCLAFCKQPTTDKDIAEGRRNFRVQVATFYGSLSDTVRSICRCSKFPTSRWLPNPTNFARLLIFVWSGIHNHDKAPRDESFATDSGLVFGNSKMFLEIRRHGSSSMFFAWIELYRKIPDTDLWAVRCPETMLPVSRLLRSLPFVQHDHWYVLIGIPEYMHGHC